MFEISERDLFWLAGYLEGEGCFSLRRAKGGTKVLQPNGTYHKLKSERRSFSIIAATTDKDIAERVAKIMRCRIKPEIRDKRGNRKPLYVACLGRRKDVRELLTLLLPLMGERRSAKIRYLLSEESKHPEFDPVARAAHMRKFRRPYKFTDTCVRVGRRWVRKSDLAKLPMLPLQ